MRTARAPLLPEGGADDCDLCGADHGQPGTWPTCPEHGHHLIENHPTDDGWRYHCPGWKCQHTHTQQERATMTSTEVALAIRAGQDMFDAKQLAALAQLGIEGAPKGDLAVFLHRCQVTGLDPFGGQITMIKRRERDGNGWRDKWTIQTEIDGYRVIAHRAARRDGVTLSYGNTAWYDEDGNAHEVWVRPHPPAAATVTIYRDNKPFPGVARFASFAAVNRDGKLMANWASMPDHMIAKCAEAQALRRAFPNDLDGIQTSDEAAHIGNRTPRLTVEQVPPPDPLNHIEQDTETLRAAIRAQFDRLGLEDTERDNYIRDLTGEDDLIRLGGGHLARILSQLEGCADIGDLRALTQTAVAS
jgi:phage recombination protein Bet